jgi:hypothetical protein
MKKQKIINKEKKEAKNMWSDVIKFLIIIFIVHFLFYIIDDKGEFCSELVLKLMLYVTLALVVFHTLINKFI